MLSNSKKLLIIEDEEMIAKGYGDHLSRRGYQVEIALGGKDGLEKVKKFFPDLIMLDLMMPDVNGLEVLQKLKEDPLTRNIPVIVLTNSNESQMVIKAAQAGADDYLVKVQYPLAELQEKINQYLTP